MSGPDLMPDRQNGADDGETARMASVRRGWHSQRPDLGASINCPLVSLGDSGYASMQQLGLVACTELKIDRGFVSSMANKREARAIVESSIDVACRLGIKSVAEGVETQEEWETLKSFSCDQGQGYLVSRPIPDQEFVALCAKEQR